MRQQILVSLTTGHCAEEIDVTETCCESKIQAAADRLGVPREWQVQRSIAEIWAMHRQRSGEALNVFMRPRINKIDIEGDARRTVQNRRHSTDEDEINLCPDQRRNDLPEINSHRDSVSAFCRRAAALQPFATCVNAFARVARKSVRGFRAAMCD